MHISINFHKLNKPRKPVPSSKNRILLAFQEPSTCLFPFSYFVLSVTMILNTNNIDKVCLFLNFLQMKLHYMYLFVSGSFHLIFFWRVKLRRDSSMLCHVVVDYSYCCIMWIIFCEYTTMYFRVCSCRCFSILYRICSVNAPHVIYFLLLMWIGYLQFVTIMDSATMDIQVHVFYTPYGNTSWFYTKEWNCWVIGYIYNHLK